MRKILAEQEVSRPGLVGRSRLAPTRQETDMRNRTEVPEPEPAPDDDNGDNGDEGDADDQ